MGLGDIWYQHLYTIIKYYPYIGYTLVMNTSGKGAQHILSFITVHVQYTCMYPISNSLQINSINPFPLLQMM